MVESIKVEQVNVIIVSYYLAITVYQFSVSLIK